MNRYNYDQRSYRLTEMIDMSQKDRTQIIDRQMVDMRLMREGEKGLAG